MNENPEPLKLLSPEYIFSSRFNLPCAKKKKKSGQFIFFAILQKIFMKNSTEIERVLREKIPKTSLMEISMGKNVAYSL